MFYKTVSQSKQYAIILTFHVTADLQLLNSNASRPYRVLVSYTLKDWECWNSSTRTVIQCHTSLRVGNIGLQVPVPYFSVIQVRGLVMLECKYAVPCLVSYKLESWECWNASTRTVFQCHTSQRVGNVNCECQWPATVNYTFVHPEDTVSVYGTCHSMCSATSRAAYFLRIEFKYKCNIRCTRGDYQIPSLIQCSLLY